MEFEDLDELIEWETRRVAAAFGVVGAEVKRYGAHTRGFEYCHQGYRYVWSLDGKRLRHIQIFQGRISCWLFTTWNLDTWEIFVAHGAPILNNFMARGLFLLGFEDESVLAQLPRLSAHDRMEARLSLPREFWPKKWLDEELANY